MFPLVYCYNVDIMNILGKNIISVNDFFHKLVILYNILKSLIFIFIKVILRGDRESFQ